MSCKEKSNASKSKHYTTMEKKVFLQILEEYKHIIEVKKSDGATLKEKEFVWNEICIKYNQSALVYQDRTAQQLKKLWANLKQHQREALTKERQSRMATGGGPPEMEATVDPDIINIAPHLMKTAPVLFSCNMTEAEINDKREQAFDIICSNETVEVLDIDENAKFPNMESIEITLQDTPTTSKENNKESTTSYNLEIEESSSQISNISRREKIDKAYSIKRKRTESLELLHTEEKLKIERIKGIINEEQELAHMKQAHEKEIANMKKEHLKEMNYLEVQHLKEMQKIEIQINRAKLRIIECQAIDKENIDPHV